MKTIAIANQKGGTGKTTTAYNLGIALTQQGYRVLMVDFDPQGNLSCYCGIPPEQDLEQTITELLMKVAYEKPLSHRECVYQSKRTDDSAPQVDFIPSNLRLASFELAMGTMMCREVLLKTCLEQYSSQYDYCIIDCSPSVGLLLTNALSAANEVIIPMQAQPFSVVGMSQLTNSISSVQRKINPGLHIRGVLLTMTQHTKVSEHYAHDVRAKYGRTLRVFTTEIPYNVKVQESQAFAIQAEPVHNTDTQSPTQTTSREEAVTDDVHEREGLSDSEPELAESQENQPEPVRQDAAGLLGAERAEPVRPDDAGGNAAVELPQDGAGCAADGGQDAARSDAESADARPQDEPSGLGTDVQQPEAAGGGNDPSDAVRSITEEPAAAESEPSPSAFSLPEFPAELLPFLLKADTTSRASNADILSFFSKTPLLIDRLRYIRESYKVVFTELLLDDDTRVGFYKESNNRYIWMLQLVNVQQIMPIQSERQPIAMVTYKSGVPYDIEQEQTGKQDKESAGPDCATICRPQDFFLNMSRTKRKRKLVEWLESCQENQVNVLDEKIPLLSFAVDFVTAYEYQKARGIKIHPGLWKDMRVDIFLVKKEN